ncbi:unnamed protein product [Caenorhabditis angaria]|uniref:G-protein coupled receptors family 1 profile domain-containing protein n=1 Tax=Caenorhabditis angaria TaxID=860376 RepID=A0A9P1IZ58_9PELO|nr:unnamed protein product [Caenorhabditis angaria]
MNYTDQPNPVEVLMNQLTNIGAVTVTFLSVVALIVNLYLLNCSRYLRRPIGVNLRLCVTLTASDALCAICYILTYLINIFFSDFSNCTSLLLEVFKLTTFTASVITLLALALNHYVGIVYPLHRNAITPKTVKCTIALAYIIPLTAYLLIFVVFPGGLRTSPFSLINSEGCKGNLIYRNAWFRVTLTTPFIIFVGLISFLYLHILIHMRNVSRDPLLKNNKNKRSNRKLLITLMMLAGSACLGWLPTTLLFVQPLFPIIIPPIPRLCLGVFAQTLHVSKLIADAFIYASRLVEIRYSMWIFKTKVTKYFTRKFDSNNDVFSQDDEDKTQVMPPEFLRYLSETKENRSVRSKRVKNEFDSVSTENKKRYGSEKQKRVTRLTENRLQPPNIHQPVKNIKSVPLSKQKSLDTPKKLSANNNSITNNNNDDQC